MGSQIHIVNCAKMTPVGAKLLPDIFDTEIGAFCLIVESEDGLILVDTGVSHEDAAGALGLKGHALGLTTGHQSILDHVEAMGASAEDVRHVVFTHLDYDHTGGLPYFPNAVAWVSEREYRAATNPRPLEKLRYVPRHFSGHERWEVCVVGDGSWRGLSATHLGLSVPIWLVDLPGHTRGHCGVVLEMDGQAILHAGDAAYAMSELERVDEAGWALRAFQSSIHVRPERARQTQKLLREFRAENPDVSVLFGHDAGQLG